MRGVGFEPTTLTSSSPLLTRVLAVNLNVCLDLVPDTKVVQLIDDFLLVNWSQNPISDCTGAKGKLCVRIKQDFVSLLPVNIDVNNKNR